MSSARGIFTTARLWIYVSCAVVAVLVSYLLGKEMMWDTLDYHLYAGFSAWHDRFGYDYFAAGAQSYLYPYVYAPFYALVRTGLPALLVASILAIVQSGILWLTYELAIAVSPPDNPRARIMVGALAVALALANPILLDQLGTSYTDILTAEVVLAAWLLLVHAVREPNAARVICAGLLLGAASGLKLTNSLHGLSACVLLLFLPTTWRVKVRLSCGFFAAAAVSFIVVVLPWSVQLQHHFGNPFFPLFNDIFRSPQFPTAPVTDSRFVPGSFAQALWRPFAMALPAAFVDDEFPSPDLRYALLLILALVTLVYWARRTLRRSPQSSTGELPRAGRGFVALASAFFVDWVLWLRVTGNGRYFLAMACVAGILCIVLTWRIFSARSRVLAIVLTSVFAVQGMQLALGTGYRTSVRWDGGPWYDISVPAALKTTPNLYFILGEESPSFVAPFLAKRSGFINPEGDYVLGAAGANGARVQELIREYAGHIRVAEMAGEFVLSPPTQLPDLAHANDTLAQFGLRVDTADCSTVIVRNVRVPFREISGATLPIHLPPQLQSRVFRVPQSTAGYLVTCHAVLDPAVRPALVAAEREPDLVFDRMESECPRLFQPSRPVSQVYGDSRSGYFWIRKYPGTGLAAIMMNGVLKLVDGTRGGRAAVIGSESDWARGGVRLACGRQGEHYYARIVSSAK